MDQARIICNEDCFARKDHYCTILLDYAKRNGECVFRKKFRSKPKDYIPKRGEKEE